MTPWLPPSRLPTYLPTSLVISAAATYLRGSLIDRVRILIRSTAFADVNQVVSSTMYAYHVAVLIIIIIIIIITTVIIIIIIIITTVIIIIIIIIIIISSSSIMVQV
eukprot:GHVU01054474.1.p1 GENE.GHVU01054474.1~~GHVU01054474.1.p1  ORF type:complete len:107 (+),score=22.13 GHVU01054474.1:466-786(+)